MAYKGRTIVLSQDQALASISGRLVSLPSPPTRIGNRWHLPVEFIGRALSVIYDTPLELRKASRLVIRGRMRVPRVVVRHDVAGNQARVTLDVAPPTPHQVLQDGATVVVRFDADLLDATVNAVQSQGLVHAITTDQTSVIIETGPRQPVYPRFARLMLERAGLLRRPGTPSCPQCGARYRYATASSLEPGPTASANGSAGPRRGYDVARRLAPKARHPYYLCARFRRVSS